MLLISRCGFSQIGNVSEWLGNWQTHFSNNMEYKIVENLTIKWSHYEHWLEFDITGNDTNKVVKWSSQMVLTLDNEHNIVGWYIDNNGYDGMATIKGVIEDNKIIIKEESSMSSGKSSWALIDGQLRCKGTSKSKESGKTYTNERVFIKQN